MTTIWDVLQRQIDALEAQLHVLKTMVQEAREVDSRPSPAECRHLETEDAGGTFGNPRRRCLMCGVIVEGHDRADAPTG